VLFANMPIDLADHPELGDLGRAAVLCNEGDLHSHAGGWTWRGDPTDIALLSLAHKLGWKREPTLETHPQINAIAFEPERRYAASFHILGARMQVLVKGAPERVAEMCSDASVAAGMLEQAESLATDGYRVLAFAQGDAPEDLNGGMVPATAALMNLQATSGNQGAVYGLNASITAAGRSLAPMLGASLAVWFGMRSVFLAAACIYAAAAIVALIIFRAAYRPR